MSCEDCTCKNCSAGFVAGGKGLWKVVCPRGILGGCGGVSNYYEVLRIARTRSGGAVSLRNPIAIDPLTLKKIYTCSVKGYRG